MKFAFRHGPAVPCRKLRRITACSAAFALWFSGAGRNVRLRSQCCHESCRCCHTPSQTSFHAWLNTTVRPYVQLMSPCVSLPVLQIRRFGLVPNSAEMTFDSTQKQVSCSMHDPWVGRRWCEVSSISTTMAAAPDPVICLGRVVGTGDRQTNKQTNNMRDNHIRIRLSCIYPNIAAHQDSNLFQNVV